MIFQKPLFEHSMIYVRRKRWDLGWCGSLGLKLGLFQQITFLSHTLALLLVLESNCLCVQIYCVFSYDNVRISEKDVSAPATGKNYSTLFFYNKSPPDLEWLAYKHFPRKIEYKLYSFPAFVKKNTKFKNLNKWMTNKRFKGKITVYLTV